MASDTTIQPKIRRVDGGDTIDVNTGGKITATGTQATVIAAQKVNYTTGDLDSEAEIIAAINATNTALNSVIAALKGIGAVATS